MAFYLRSRMSDKSTIYYGLQKQKYGRKIRIQYSTGITIPTSLWDETKQRISRSKIVPFYDYNTTLQKIEQKVYELLDKTDIQKLTAAKINKELDFVTGKSIRKKQKITKMDFLDFYNQELEEMRIAQLNVKGHDNLRRKYQKYRDLKTKINASRMDWEDFDWQWHDDFVLRMEAKGYTLNYVGKLVGYVKYILGKGERYGHNDFTIYKEFPVKTEQVRLPYLNEDQLLAIYELKLPKGGYLDNARDNFLLGCWTGMRVGNYKSLDPDKNFDWEKGILQFGMNKNGGRQVIPIHWMVKEIWEKYDGGLPRQIGDSKLNEYIKIVAEKAGLVDNYVFTKTVGGRQVTFNERLCDLVCSHTARRSLCTNLYLNKVPIKMIMACSGHKSEKQCYKYIKASTEEMLGMVLDLPVWKKPEKKGKVVNMKTA